MPGHGGSQPVACLDDKLAVHAYLPQGVPGFAGVHGVVVVAGHAKHAILPLSSLTSTLNWDAVPRAVG